MSVVMMQLNRKLTKVMPRRYSIWVKKYQRGIKERGERLLKVGVFRGSYGN